MSISAILGRFDKWLGNTTESFVKNLLNEVDYFADPRTGLCFARMKNGPGFSISVISSKNVNPSLLVDYPDSTAIQYFKDPRTGLCFAFLHTGAEISYANSITEVPYESVKHLLLN